MGCLYCGKEIGPVQLLKDGDFCGSAHRKQYGERLSKILLQISRPAPAPPAAGFVETVAPSTGDPRHALPCPVVFGSGRAVELSSEWQIPIGPVLGSKPRRLPGAAPAARSVRPSTSDAVERGPALPEAPPFEIAPARPHPAPETVADSGPQPQIGPRAVAFEPAAAFPGLLGLALPVPALIPPVPALLNDEPAPCGDAAEPPQQYAPPPLQAWRSGPGVEPAAREVQPCAHLVLHVSPAMRPPAVDLRIYSPRIAATAAAAGLAPGIVARGVQQRATATLLPAERTARLTLPRVSALSATGGGALKPEEKWGELEPVVPAESGSRKTRADQGVRPATARPSVLPEMRLEADRAFAAPPEEPERYRMAELVPLEYHAQPMRGSQIRNAGWMASRFAIREPGFLLRIPPEEFASVCRPTRQPKTSGPAKVVRMPAGAAKAAESQRWRIAGTIAAGLFVGLIVWGGTSAVRIGSGTAVINRDASAPDGPDPAAAAAYARTGGAARRREPAGARAQSKGPLAWVRATVAKRAAVELTDSFRGMEAWGMAAKAWAPGWSRHPDGYVRTGQLALFNPSKEFRNYRLEFFAEIEKKSVGWAVRAQDRRNYYAMKFTVVEPGPRQVIAMVHYPVVGGKPGRRMEIPLPRVMVHDHEPYRVSVEVKGNRVVTSIEGQEVDSWTDNTLASGGIGFFSEAGEQARLYWMKVAANNDFLGRICAYVAGPTGSAATAAAFPAGPNRHAPEGPAAPLAAVAVLPLFTNRRKQPWTC